jgi:hypothetical protein
MQVEKIEIRDNITKNENLFDDSINADEDIDDIVYDNNE